MDIDKWANSWTNQVTAFMGMTSNSVYYKRGFLTRKSQWKLYESVFVGMFEEVNQWPCPVGLFVCLSVKGTTCSVNSQTVSWCLIQLAGHPRASCLQSHESESGSIVQFGLYTAQQFSFSTPYQWLSQYCVLHSMAIFLVGNFLPWLLFQRLREGTRALCNPSTGV